MPSLIWQLHLGSDKSTETLHKLSVDAKPHQDRAQPGEERRRATPILELELNIPRVADGYLLNPSLGALRSSIVM